MEATICRNCSTGIVPPITPSILPFLVMGAVTTTAILVETFEPRGSETTVFPSRSASLKKPRSDILTIVPAEVSESPFLSAMKSSSYICFCLTSLFRNWVTVPLLSFITVLEFAKSVISSLLASIQRPKSLLEDWAEAVADSSRLVVRSCCVLK